MVNITFVGSTVLARGLFDILKQRVVAAAQTVLKILSIHVVVLQYEKEAHGMRAKLSYSVSM